jgi:hypothetical protein
MQKLALAFLIATGAVAFTTASTASPDFGKVQAGRGQVLALACCDDPPPACWPNPTCDDDKQNPPDGGQNRTESQR